MNGSNLSENIYIYIKMNRYKESLVTLMRERETERERERRVHYHCLAKKARIPATPNNKKQVQTTEIKEQL